MQAAYVRYFIFKGFIQFYAIISVCGFVNTGTKLVSTPTPTQEPAASGADFSLATKRPPAPCKSLTMARCSLSIPTMGVLLRDKRGRPGRGRSPWPLAWLCGQRNPIRHPPRSNRSPGRTHRAGRHCARLAPRPPEVRAVSGAAGRSRKRRRDPLWSSARTTEFRRFFRWSFCIPHLPLGKLTPGPTARPVTCSLCSPVDLHRTWHLLNFFFSDQPVQLVNCILCTEYLV